MKYLALMTKDFKVIKADQNGYLYAASLSSLTDLDNIIYLAQQGNKWNLLITKPFISWFDAEIKGVKRAFPAGNVNLIFPGEEKFCEVQIGDLTYMHVLESGRVAYSRKASAEKTECSFSFRLLTQCELHKLYHVARNQWAIDPLVKSVRLAEDKSNFHEFYLGDLLIPLNEFFAYVSDVTDINEFVFLSGRNIYRAVLFKPAVFLASYGEKAFRQLSVALASLEDPGNYDGKLFIITDADPVTVAAVMPRNLRASVDVLPLEAHDFLDFVAVRQTIISSGLLEEYSPVLYIDIDVMMNMPMDKTLCLGALEKWFSAQREEWIKGADFRYINTTGEYFFSQDPFPVDHIEAGFNSGVFFLPVYGRNKAYMDLCFTSHKIYTVENGRKTPFPEQQFLNYALHKLDAVDCNLVTNLTEVGGDPGSVVVKFHGGMDVTKTRGIIHYWCIESSIRPRLMSDYLNRVREYRHTLK